MRLDVALHALRLFKSRSQAQAAIAEGHVRLNGDTVKPSHELKPGDRLTLEGEGHRRTVQVLELPHRSLSREAARALLREVGEG